MCPKCGYNSELENFIRDVKSGKYYHMPARDFEILMRQMQERHRKSNALRIAEIDEQIAHLRAEKIRLEEANGLSNS